MFVQVIQGTTSDATGIRALVDRWVDELGPDAPGWLGSTIGVTDDGTFIAVARFTDADQAARNSERPQQSAWWAEFSKHLDGEATFSNCTAAETFLDGGSDDAGFVQVMQSQVTDKDKAARGLAAMSSMKPEDFGRTDLLGGIIAAHDDGAGLTQVAYFTSEAEARAAESQPPPAAAQEAMQEWANAVSDITYFDLKDPWMASPASAR